MPDPVLEVSIEGISSTFVGVGVVRGEELNTLLGLQTHRKPLFHRSYRRCCHPPLRAESLAPWSAEKPADLRSPAWSCFRLPPLQEVVVLHKDWIGKWTQILIIYNKNLKKKKKSNLYSCCIGWQNKSVKSKETVGNSWTVLKVILGHKYHHNH